MVSRELGVADHPQPKHVTSRDIVLAGASDGKPLSDSGRVYAEGMPNCRVARLVGRNVLPWESTRETCDAVGRFVADL